MTTISYPTNDLGQPVGEAVPDWTPRAHPPCTPMVGRTCRLEPLDVDRHAEALFEAFAADETGRDWTYLPYGPFDDIDGFTGWMTASCLDEDPQFHAILDADTGRPLGMTSYLRINPAVGSIEVGHIHYAPALQGTTAATETMVLMMRRAFDELGYRRYEWKCDAANAPSRRAAERLGFTYEGTHRQATVVKGRNRDTSWYSILDREWPALRDAFEEWLAPANFDGDGRQRRPLSAVIAASRSTRPA